MKSKFNLYPAIDIKDGKCVRLLFGDMNRETIYNDNPVDQAMWFVDQGAEWLHIVDLDGAIEGKSINKTVIKKILKSLNNKVKIQIGGGIRSKNNIDFWLENSADKIILGTLLIEKPNFFSNLSKIYSNKLIIAVDVRNNRVATHGWTKQSGLMAAEFINTFDPFFISSIIFTDISRDGSLKGINIDSTVNFANSIQHPVIASGGVSSLDDIVKLIEKRNNGVQGVIIGRALYEKKFTFSDALKLLTEDTS